jgi:hypothetical protein
LWIRNCLPKLIFSKTISANIISHIHRFAQHFGVRNFRTQIYVGHAFCKFSFYYIYIFDLEKYFLSISFILTLIFNDSWYNSLFVCFKWKRAYTSCLLFKKRCNISIYKIYTFILSQIKITIYLSCHSFIHSFIHFLINIPLSFCLI